MPCSTCMILLFLAVLVCFQEFLLCISLHAEIKHLYVEKCHLTYLPKPTSITSFTLTVSHNHNFRSSHRRCSLKKGVLRKFSKFIGKQLCQSLFFNKVAGLRPQACNFIRKETLAQIFSCEFCEIFKNTFFTEHLRTTASTISWKSRRTLKNCFVSSYPSFARRSGVSHLVNSCF